MSQARRILPWLVIVPYAALTFWGFARHAEGRPARSPLGYFWTWDMFPNYPTEQVRRHIVGERADGRFAFLEPHAEHEFRWGVKGDLRRVDLDGRIPFLRRRAEQALAQARGAGEPDFRRVHLVESATPLRFNLPETLYEQEYGEPHPLAEGGRITWRVVESLEVRPGGALESGGESP